MHSFNDWRTFWHKRCQNPQSSKLSEASVSPLSILTPSSYREKSRYLWNQYLCSSSSSSISLGIGIIFLRLFFPFFFCLLCAWLSGIPLVVVFSFVAVARSILSGAQSTLEAAANRETAGNERCSGLD